MGIIQLMETLYIVPDVIVVEHCKLLGALNVSVQREQVCHRK